MPYHIDEENSELAFEVYDGDKLIIRLKSGAGSGSGGCDIYIIKSGDNTEPTESNVFSARRTLLNFLRKDDEDTTEFLLRLLGGIISPFIESPDFISGVLGAGFSIKQNANKQSVAEFDKLIVRLKATFQMLEILKTELGGSDMLFNSSGARIKITEVERLDQEAFFITGDKAYFSDEDEIYFPDIFRCYFLSDDTEEAVENLFKSGDFAQSKSFNIKEGVYENVGNHYWWRKVVGVGDDYIELSTVDMDSGSDDPKEGDVVVQLGNDKDQDRQNAIIISAFGENAPYISMLQGIDSYSLSDKAIFTVGYDRANKECYLKNYGRTYIGDHNNKRYFDLSKNGLVVKATKFIFETGEDVSEEFKSVKTSISVMDGKISLKVSNDDLASTGIDIDKKTVTVTSERFFVNNSKGSPIAVFTTDSSGKPILKADYIDVENLKVKHLDGADGTFTGNVSIANKIFLNSDGSGSLANGNIIWDTSGNLKMTYSFKIEKDGYVLKMDPEFAEYLIEDYNGYSLVRLSPYTDLPGYSSPELILNHPDKQGQARLNVTELSVGDPLGTYGFFGYEGIQFRKNGEVYNGYTGKVSIPYDDMHNKNLYFKGGILYKVAIELK
jgi:hypothetical protein|nr:MAG TPA: tail protein [Caudoviricetes sp.]